MSRHELSFAPDRRSVQTTFFHFSERPSGEADKRGFSQQDAQVWALEKIYQSKFVNISQQLRNILVNTIVTEIPLAHNNLTMLAAAEFIVYHMRSNRITLNTDPSTFTNQCDQTGCLSIDSAVVSCKQSANEQVNAQNRITFEAYFNFVAAFIMPDVTGKKPEEILTIRASHKITLLRYIRFIQNSTTNYMVNYTGQAATVGQST
jgi:hypothetical protein